LFVSLGGPVSQPTSLPVSVIADTIVRTVELGATITNAALDGETTMVFVLACLRRRFGPLGPPAAWAAHGSDVVRVPGLIRDVSGRVASAAVNAPAP